MDRAVTHYLSLSEVAEVLGISERTTYRWIKAGKLRAYKPGRDYRIPKQAIREAIEGGGPVSESEAMLHEANRKRAEVIRIVRKLWSEGIPFHQLAFKPNQKPTLESHELDCALLALENIEDRLQKEATL